MVIHVGVGEVLVPLVPSANQSKSNNLEAEINMVEIMLRDLEENGHRQVYEKIEELRVKLTELKREQQKIEESSIHELKIRRTKPYQWNWR